MGVSWGEPAEPFERITEALAMSTNERPIDSDKVPRRTGSR